MVEMISVINNITKYGLQAHSALPDEDKTLEKSLVKPLYELSFGLSYEFDSNEYRDFDTSAFPDIRRNIESNFKDFGFYKTVLDPLDLDDVDNFGIGDAVYDLHDIIIELLQVKWRIESNSLADGLWYFELAFSGHIKEHLINLLNYIEHKNS